MIVAKLDVLSIFEGMEWSGLVLDEKLEVFSAPRVVKSEWGSRVVVFRWRRRRSVIVDGVGIKSWVMDESV